MNDLENNVEMEPERLELLRILEECGLPTIYAAYALTDGLPPLSVIDKSVRKQAIRLLRSSNCWHGKVKPEEIDKAANLLRGVTN